MFVEAAHLDPGLHRHVLLVGVICTHRRSRRQLSIGPFHASCSPILNNPQWGRISKESIMWLMSRSSDRSIYSECCCRHASKPDEVRFSRFYHRRNHATPRVPPACRFRTRDFQQLVPVHHRSGDRPTRSSVELLGEHYSKYVLALSSPQGSPGSPGQPHGLGILHLKTRGQLENSGSLELLQNIETIKIVKHIYILQSNRNINIY